MNRSEFIAITAIILFVAFVTGWVANAVVRHLTRQGRADMDELDVMAQQLHNAEQARDQAVAQLQTREAELTRHIASRDADLQATMDALGEARAEVEELREYIEKLRTRR